MAYKLQRSYHMVESEYESLDKAVEAAAAQAGKDGQAMAAEDGHTVLSWDGLKARIGELRDAARE